MQFKLSKDKQHLEITIPLFQKSYDTTGKHTHDTINIVGVIAGDEYSLSQVVDLGYKGTQQEGMPIIMLDSREELERVCKEFDIDIIEHEICSECGKVIYGVHTLGDKGALCLECEDN